MSQPPTKPVKVLLWSTPRSLSTLFFKSMTFDPNTIGWFEPWLQVGRYGKDQHHPLGAVEGSLRHKLIEKMGGKAAVEKLSSGFDASNATFEWVKGQLEGDFHGKNLVFVKELSSEIVDKMDTIPQGFTHSFLIRHPAKVALSWKKVMETHSAVVGSEDINSAQQIQQIYGRTTPFKDSYNLLQYVKENYKPDPIVIDADDLLQDPSKVLEAYCKGVGISYSPKLLTWDAGDENMINKWMVPREFILISGLFAAHKTTFSSTGFYQQDKKPAPALSELPLYMQLMVENEMPYYQQLYAERIICN